MSDNKLVIQTPDGPIDPLDYDTLVSFKDTVYKYGVGTWGDDKKLTKLYVLAHEAADAEEETTDE